MSLRDQLWRFTFEGADVRGELAQLAASWREISRQRDYPPRVRELLGEMTAAAVLLSANLKYEGALQLQVQGQGPLRLLVVQCTHALQLRALAHWDGEVPDTAGLAALVGDGICTVTLDTGEGQPYQGMVPLEGDSIAGVLEAYLARSEQIETRMWLAAGADAVAGLLLQRLPEGGTQDADAWNRMTHLGGTVRPEELLQLPARQILHRLFHEEDVRLYDPAPVRFECRCSAERVRAVLRMLGPDEIHAILAERGHIGIECDYCGKHYEFDAVDAEQALAAQIVTPAGKTRH